MAEPIAWRLGAARASLHTCDPTLRARAERVFGPWLTAADLPELRRFEVSRDDDGWRLAGADGARYSRADRVIEHLEYNAAWALLDAPHAGLTSHGALVSRDGRGALICGPRRAGKSTLACALWAAGWCLHTDDIALLDAAAGRAEGAPRRMSLRATSRPLLGEACWQRLVSAETTSPTEEGFLVCAHELDPAAAAPVELSAVVFLGREDLGPAALARLSPIETLMALLPTTNAARAAAPAAALEALGERPPPPSAAAPTTGELIETLRPLALRARGAALGRGPLPAMVAAIKELLQ